MSKRMLYILLIIDIIAIIGITVYVAKNYWFESSFPAFSEENISVPDSLPSASPKTKPEPEPQNVQPSLSKKTKRKIRFQYRNSRPREVSVLGEFSDWEPIPMLKGKNHTWSATVDISPGSYLYCYDIDGRLIPDPNNPNLQILSGNEKRSKLTVKPIAK